MKVSLAGYYAATFAAALKAGPSCEPGLELVRDATPPLRGTRAIKLRSTCGRMLDVSGPYGVFSAAPNRDNVAPSLVGSYVGGAVHDEHAITIGHGALAGAKSIIAVATDADGRTLLQSFELGLGVSQQLEESQSANLNATCKTCNSPEILCQDKCQNPPQTCTFYSSCAEAALPCGSSGYAIGYGLKNCDKFMQRLSHFSTAGQAWIFRVMTCLQKFLSNGPLQRCGLDCSSLKSDAFSSHPACYVDSGVCDLPIGDWVQLVITIRDDLLTLDTLKQAVTTGGNCLAHYLQETSDEIQKLEDQLHHTIDPAKTLAEIAALRSVRHIFE